MENSRRCDICKIDVQRASFAKHLRSKQQLKNLRQDDLIIPDWLLREPIENIPRRIHNPKSLKEIARDNIKVDDEKPIEELAKKINNPYWYVKNPLKPSAILNIETDDRYCLLWSISASLHSCENDHCNRVSMYRQNFHELDIQGFNSSDGFKCSDVHKFEKLNNSSINIFELGYYQDEKKRKHKLIPVAISKNNSDRIVDLLIYKNHCFH